jgi:hypothetical protein
MALFNGRRLQVKHALFANVAVSFISIGILIMLGKMLVFNIVGTDYSRLTVAGFICTVYISFITFQPANSLFGVRKLILDGKVDVPPPESGDIPVRNPWLMTLPISFLVALLLAGIAASLVFLVDRVPSPAVAALASLLYVIPHYFLARLFVERDAASFSAGAPVHPASSRAGHFWIAYFLPNFLFQMLIGIPLALRGFIPFGQELSFRLFHTARVIPAALMGMDLVMTFILICNFTFLAVNICASSDLHRGIISGENDRPLLHRFFCFLIMLASGFLTGGIYVFIIHATGHDQVSFPAALCSQVAGIFLAVYFGARFGMEWTAVKIPSEVAVSA